MIAERWENVHSGWKNEVKTAHTSKTPLWISRRAGMREAKLQKSANHCSSESVMELEGREETLLWRS